MLEDDGITAAIEELQSRLGDLQSSIDQALQVYCPLVGYFMRMYNVRHPVLQFFKIVFSTGRSVRKYVLVFCAINTN